MPGSLSGAGAFDADFDIATSEGGDSGASGPESFKATCHLSSSAPPGYAPAPRRMLHLQQAQNFLDEAALYSSGLGAGCWMRWREGWTGW